MKKVIVSFLFLFFQFSANYSSAQDTLSGVISLNHAIQLALGNNFDIQISKVELEQDKANNTIGNAGMLPSINAIGGVQGNLSNSKEILENGAKIVNPKATSSVLNGAVQLNWTLFDGFSMFINKRRLNEIENSGNIALRQQIQSTVASVISTYANVVRQKQQLVAIDTALSLAQVRMEIAEKKFEIGTTDKTDFLQAKVDYNASSSQLLLQQATLREAKDSLMILINENQFADFDVEDSLVLNKNLEFKDKELWLDDNLSMQLARQDKLISTYDLKLVKAAQLPTLGLSAAYNYNRAENDFNTIPYNRSFGPQAGLNLNIPIFNGFNLQREKKIAQQEVFRKELITDRLALNLSGNYRTVWRSYQNALQTLDLEQENIKYAQENLMIQQARFRVGLANTLELRQAENSYVAGLSRLVDAAYLVKVSETKILELEQRLVQ